MKPEQGTPRFRDTCLPVMDKTGVNYPFSLRRTLKCSRKTWKAIKPGKKTRNTIVIKNVSLCYCLSDCELQLTGNVKNSFLKPENNNVSSCFLKARAAGNKGAQGVIGMGDKRNVPLLLAPKLSYVALQRRSHMVWKRLDTSWLSL